MSGRGRKATAPKRKANGYKMPAPIPPGEIITDTVMKKKWRIGPSIGVGGFGEIYSACEHENSPKKGSSYPYVIKIEPHENGPLFVEKNFYMRNANKDDITKFMKSRKLAKLGMPSFYGNGSHDFKGEKYRYLVLERYGKDIWSIFKDNGRKFPVITVFQLGLQMLDVLEYIHSRGYVHADLKGANILLGMKKGTENQAYLLDFGLATRVTEKEFKPDPKCAHNGTIEYTSRDAHLGVPTMRGDLEILGYNMLQWLIGELPWEKSLKQPKTVQESKENFMKQLKTNIANYGNVPDALTKFLEYINTLKPKDVPDYAKCRQIFEGYLKSEGVSKNAKLDFSAPKKSRAKKNVIIAESDNESEEDVEEEEEVEELPKKKKSPARRAKQNGEKTTSEKTKRKKVVVKRKSLEPVSVAKTKKTKLIAKTPPVKKNHVNTATQTSVEKKNSSARSVSFDSPIAEVIGEKRNSKTSNSANSSGDIFEDSFTETGKKSRGRRKLMTVEKEVLQRVVRRKVTTTKSTASWKNSPAIVNGKAPPVS